ncbi:MAG TPA: hypothetical protein VF883_02030 [Thermoanaerobaculia bacterium]|jgi:tetratricopeptide (TPR) repeat protein
MKRGPDPARIAEFAETARRLQLEREEAASVVDRLLRETPRERWGELAELPDLRTAGALDRLGVSVAQALGRDPRHALAIAELATKMAESLPADLYPTIVIAQLRAHAYKDLGKTLLYLGRLSEALAAVDRADSYIGEFGALEHDRAIVGVVRATMLHEANRYEEAFELLTRCKDIFRNYGDEKRLLMCGISEGVLLHRMRKYREAREAYLLLLAGTSKSSDPEAVACLHNVIGHCSIDLGDYTAAEENLSRAIELFHAVGQPVQAAKAELGRGRMLVRMGDVSRGIAHLRPIRADFLRYGMTEEAGLCGLEIVEALLIRGAADKAETLAREITTEFTVAGLNERAITALGYLREAIAAHRASVGLVTSVREYIVSLRTSPEREFITAE